MAQFLIKVIAPDATSRDQLFNSEQEANDYYDGLVQSPNPDAVARVVMYQRGVSVAVRSTDVTRDEGPVTAPATAGPEPLNTEGHIVQGLEDASDDTPENVTVEDTEQVDNAGAFATVPTEGDSQGAVTVEDANVPGAVDDDRNATATTTEYDHKRGDHTIQQGFRDRDNAPDDSAYDSETESAQYDAAEPHNEQTAYGAPGADATTGDTNTGATSDTKSNP